MRDRYFEWLDGDDRGKVVKLTNVYEEDGETFFEFDDGNTCSKNYIAKMAKSQGDMIMDRKKGGKFIPAFMIEVYSPSNAWTWEKVTPKMVNLDGGQPGGRMEEAPSLEDIAAMGSGRDGDVISSNGKLRLTPPRNTNYDVEELPDIKDYGKPVKVEKPKYEEDEEEVEVEEKRVVKKERKVEEKEVKTIDRIVVETPIDDPVSILVSSANKYPRTVSLDIEMNLPTKDLFNIVQQNFDNGVDKFIDNIVRDIDVKQIISALKMSLKESYMMKLENKKEVEKVDEIAEKCSIISKGQDIMVEFDENGEVKEQKFI